MSFIFAAISVILAPIAVIAVMVLLFYGARHYIRKFHAKYVRPKTTGTIIRHSSLFQEEAGHVTVNKNITRLSNQEKHREI